MALQFDGGNNNVFNFGTLTGTLPWTSISPR